MTVPCSIFLDIPEVSVAGWQRSFKKGPEEPVHFFGCGGHPLFQSVCGIVAVSQKPCHLQSELCYPEDQLTIVMFISAEGSARVGPEKLLAEVATVCILHEGHKAGSMEGKEPAFHPFLTCKG